MISGKNERLRIVALGDSTTAGTPGFLSPLESPPNGSGDGKSQFAFWMMEVHPEWSVLNRGINGERTDQILARFEMDVVREHPSVVIILAGVNDIYQGHTAEPIQENIAKMYRKTLEIGAKGVGCSVLPYNTITSEQDKVREKLNSWIESECRRTGFGFCDTAKATSSEAEPDRLSASPDGIHPSVDGYRAMGNALVMTVEALLSAG